MFRFNFLSVSYYCLLSDFSFFPFVIVAFFNLLLALFGLLPSYFCLCFFWVSLFSLTSTMHSVLGAAPSWASAIHLFLCLSLFVIWSSLCLVFNSFVFLFDLPRPFFALSAVCAPLFLLPLFLS